MAERIRATEHGDAYTIPEFARRLSIGRTSVYKLAKEGKLRLIKVAGRTLVPRTEIERLTQA
jgi:excisionase family DNA binding protein